MEGAFLVIIVVVVVVGLLAGVWAGHTSGEAYRQIGRGGLSLDDPGDRPPEPVTAGSGGEHAVEIRQMLEARNRRRAARGQAPVDVEAELEGLLRAAGAGHRDPALEAEVRDLVLARNARRVRTGRPPLDVEAEVARSLADLRGGSAP
jgi:hypothetical protein